jgi:hypothetical protein
MYFLIKNVKYSDFMSLIEEFYAKNYAKLSELTEHYKRRLNLAYRALRTLSEQFFGIRKKCISR